MTAAAQPRRRAPKIPRCTDDLLVPMADGPGTDEPPAGGHAARPETCRRNRVPEANEVHAPDTGPNPDSDPLDSTPPDRDPMDSDPMDDATDPRAEVIAEAVAVVRDAIARSSKDPGILARDEFADAVRLLRVDAPDEWFALRGLLKDAARAAGLKLADIERGVRPEGGGAGDEATVADELVALVQGRAELFHAADGSCYAALSGDGPRRTYRLDTLAWAQWASYAYYTDTATDERPGRAASETAIRTARTVLTGIATHEGDERAVYLRAARHDEAYYIDLGSDDWSAVEVMPTGWRIIARPPVHFWRPGTLRPLPLPVPGGDLALLWKYANIPEPARPLALAWLIDAWRPETPFAVAELTGQQGTAKSGTQTKLRRCIDPNAVDLRAAPKSVEDLFVSAGANWCASLNNLSHLSAGIQDALCSLATGGGFAARTLYTNVDESLIEAKRPVIINGIVPLVTAQDLTDRVVHIDLPELTEYRRETDLDAEFETDAPHIVGGLLDLFVRTLAVLPSVTLHRPPRMADYAALGEAMVIAQGGRPGEFLALYRGNRRDSVARSLESSPVACAVSRIVDAYTGQASVVWTGTVGALRVALEPMRDGHDAWPRSDKGLSDALRRQRPALAQIGIAVEFGGKERDGRHVTIAKKCDGGDGGDGGDGVSDRYSPGAACSDHGEDRV